MRVQRKQRAREETDGGPRRSGGLTPPEGVAGAARRGLYAPRSSVPAGLGVWLRGCPRRHVAMQQVRAVKGAGLLGPGP